MRPHLGADLPKQVATGEVVAASANDVERIGNAFDILPRMVGAVIAFLVVAAILIDTNALLGIIVLVGVPLLSLGVAPLVRPLERREREQRVHLGLTQELAADTVAGLRVLRGIGGEDLFLERFQKRVAEGSGGRRPHRADPCAARRHAGVPARALRRHRHLARCPAGARRASSTVGQLVAFYGYTAFLVLPLRTVTEAAHKWTAARVASARVVTVLTLERTVRRGRRGDGAESRPRTPARSPTRRPDSSSRRECSPPSSPTTRTRPTS